jgi:predicted GNAT family N-acyltransferase
VASISTRLSEAELEQLYAGFVRLARLDGTELAALLEHVLAGNEPGLSSYRVLQGTAARPGTIALGLVVYRTSARRAGRGTRLTTRSPPIATPHGYRDCRATSC